MSKKPKNEDLLTEAIENTGVVSVLVRGSTDQQVKLRVRVSNENRWKHMITFLLREEVRVALSELKWNLHVCQTYLLKEGRLVYTWSFVLQSSDIDKAVMEVCRLFDLIRSNMSLFEERGEEEVIRPKKAQASNQKSNKLVGEIREYPLVGASPDRNKPARHYLDFRGRGRSKGAHYIGGE